MRNPMTIAAFAALALLPGQAARAETACSAEIRRFCEGKAPLEVLSCLQAHHPELSDACRQRIESVEVDLQNAKLDCEEDAFAYCRDAAGGEPMVTCLSKNQGKLTRRCQMVFDEFARKEAANRSACGDDARRLCPGAKAGKGDVHVCLVFHGKDVSPACREALTR